MKWTGKSKGNSWGYAFFIKLLKTAGLKPAYFCLYFVAFWFFLFSSNSSKAIFYFYRERLKFNYFRSIIAVYLNYVSFGKSLLDRIAVMSGVVQFKFEFDGEEYLHQMAQDNKGGFLISAHVGNWEIAGFFLNRIQSKFNIVMFDAENKKIKELLDKQGKNRNVNFIFIKDDMSHMYQIAEALENKEMICIHADRFLPGAKSIEAVFFEEHAEFPTGPFLMASRFKVPVTYVFGMKEKSDFYHLYATPPKLYDWGRKAENIENGLNDAMKDYTSQMEQKALKYPYQWYNYFQFWKHAE